MVGFVIANEAKRNVAISDTSLGHEIVSLPRRSFQLFLAMTTISIGIIYVLKSMSNLFKSKLSLIYLKVFRGKKVPAKLYIDSKTF